MDTPAIFISYRRDDSQFAAIAIADAMRRAFGEDSVFFDRRSIEIGTEWPQRISDALAGAIVVLVVMGPQWMICADRYGRRRIDHPDDWVRKEVIAGLNNKAATVVPVLFGGLSPLPPEALDKELQPLCAVQACTLREDAWDEGLHILIESIIAVSHGTLSRIDDQLTQYPDGAPKPTPHKQQAKPLSEEELDQRILALPEWRIEWSPHPWGIGGKAQELRRTLVFETFPETIEFMQFAAHQIDDWKPPHHPRWQNQWRALKVWYSTWDAGCRLTKFDFDAAKQFNNVYGSYIATKS